MRIRLALTLTIGDKPAPDDERYVDAIGHY